jgi:hypothetical protein
MTGVYPYRQISHMVVLDREVEELRQEVAALKEELAALRAELREDLLQLLSARGQKAENPNLGWRLVTDKPLEKRVTEQQVKEFIEAGTRIMAPACGTGCCPTCGSWMEGYCAICHTYTEKAAGATPCPKMPEVPVSVGIFDAHDNTWTPAHGKEEELGKLLGEKWTFDTYYGKFFTAET